MKQPNHLRTMLAGLGCGLSSFALVYQNRHQAHRNKPKLAVAKALIEHSLTEFPGTVNVIAADYYLGSGALVGDQF